MDEVKSLVTYRTDEYGRIIVKLSEVMDRRDMTRNRLATLMGVKYAVVDRYYKNKQIALVDLDFLAKVCYVLDCKIEDLLEYQKPEEAPEQGNKKPPQTDGGN